MSVTAIRSKLLQKLQEMQTIKAAYDWETANPDGNYPFATVTLRIGQGKYESTAHSLRNRGFRIRIYQERTKIGQGSEVAEDIVTDILDELEKALDMDVTLSGACKYAQPVGWDANYVDRDVDTRVLEINVDAYELVNSQK